MQFIFLFTNICDKTVFFLRFDISTFISHVLTFYLFKHLYTENGSEWGVKRSRVDWAFTKTGQALNHSKQKNITK